MSPLKLNWEPWVYGLFSSLIGGGAGAVSAAIGVNLIDAKDWNLSDHPGHLFALMGICFIINGSIATCAYLAKSPLPQIETVTTVQTVQPVGQGIKSTTVTTTDTKESKP